MSAKFIKLTWRGETFLVNMAKVKVIHEAELDEGGGKKLSIRTLEFEHSGDPMFVEESMAKIYSMIGRA